MLSQKLITLLKLSATRQYRIAQEAGLHPSTLSGIINGIAKVRPMDERVIKVGKILGLSPEECFKSK